MLFRQLAKEGKLTSSGFGDDKWSAQSSKYSSASISFTSASFGFSTLRPAPSTNGPFCLWADDLRGENILLEKTLQVKAVTGWEFAYAGPRHFALDPPWWLLLAEPENWRGGIEEWAKAYMGPIEVWLKSMGAAESMEELSEAKRRQDARERDGTIEPARLSVYMRESWETGRFWLNYAARNGSAFDFIYWNYLDEKFWGLRDAVSGNDDDNNDERCDHEFHDVWKSRLGLLTGLEKEAMEPYVERKMAEDLESEPVYWDPEEARQYFARHLF